MSQRDKPQLALNNITAGVRECADANRTREAGHLDEIQGVVANTLKLYRQGAVGFIDWLDPLWPYDFISLSTFPRRTFSTRLFPPDESAMSTSSPASRT